MDDNYKSIDPESNFGKMMKKMEGVNLSKFYMPSHNVDYDFINRQIQESIPKIEVEPIIPENYFEKSQKYQEQSLEMLKSISQNTANLYTLVDLIIKSNEKQDEVLEIITEVLAMAKAKDKKEADSIFKKIMTKITDSVETTESVVKLIGWATTIYNMVVAILSQ